jgi:site-specific DNA-methyltransferase (adenine-specific)
MYSSDSCEWATPQEFFDALDAEFGFEIDVCAGADNHKCDFYFDKNDDGLSLRWHPFTCWMNPPYGREIGKWMAKAHEEADRGATVVCLVPARTDTAWWHDHAAKADEIRFVRGRLKFIRDDGKNDSAPFPSAVVIFRGGAR